MLDLIPYFGGELTMAGGGRIWKCTRGNATVLMPSFLSIDNHGFNNQHAGEYTTIHGGRLEIVDL